MSDIEWGRFEISSGPKSVGDNISYEEFRQAEYDRTLKVENAGSFMHLAIQEFDKRNDAIAKATGEKTFHPYRDLPGPEIDAEYRRHVGAGNVDTSRAAFTEQYMLKRYDTWLKEIQAKHAAFGDVIQADKSPLLSAKAIADAAERKAADLSQAVGMYEGRKLPVVGGIPVVRDAAAFVGNLATRPGYTLNSLAGGLMAQMTDPVDATANLLGFAAGRATDSILKAAMKNAASNAAIEATMQPLRQMNRRDLGLEYGLEHAIEGIGGAAALGGVLDMSVRVPGRAAIKTFGRDAPAGEWFSKHGRGGFALDAIENVPAIKPIVREIPTEAEIKKAQAGDLEALEAIATKIGAIEDPAVKGALDHAKLNGGIDDATIARFREMGIDYGEGMEMLAHAVQGATYVRPVDPIPPASAPLDAAAGAALIPRLAELEGKIDGIDTRLLHVGLEDGLPDVIGITRAVLKGDMADAGKRIEAAGGIDGLQDRITVHTSNDLVAVAQAIRRTPGAVDGNVSMRTDFIKQARAVAALDEPAFVMVANGDVSPAVAALVANIVPPGKHVQTIQNLGPVESIADARAKLLDAIPTEPTPTVTDGVTAIADPIGPEAKAQTEALAKSMPEVKAQEDAIKRREQLESQIEALRGEIAKGVPETVREDVAPSAKTDASLISPEDRAILDDLLARVGVGSLDELAQLRIGGTTFGEAVDTILGRITKTESVEPKAPRLDAVHEKRVELRTLERELEGVQVDQASAMQDNALFRMVVQRAQLQRMLDIKRAVDDALRLGDKILPSDVRVDVKAEEMFDPVSGRLIDAVSDSATGDITLARYAMNPAGRIGHEGVHTLVTRGLLSPQEVELLAQAGRERGLFKQENDYRSAYAHRDDVDRLVAEEAAAAAIEARVNGDDLGPANTMADRVKQFIERIRNALTGYGFKTADDVANAVLSGEVAKREAHADWMRNAQSEGRADDDPLFALSPKAKRMKAEGTAAQWINRNESAVSDWQAAFKGGLAAIEPIARQRFEQASTDQAIADAIKVDLRGYLDRQAENPGMVDPQVQMALDTYKADPDAAAKQINQYIERQRTAGLREWRQYLTETNPDYAKDAFWLDYVWSDIVKSDAQSPSLPPPMLPDAIGDVYVAIMDDPNQRSFATAYAEAAALRAREQIAPENNVSIGLDKTWVKIPQTAASHPDFKKNEALIRSLSCRGWCTASSMAGPYIRGGDFWILTEDGKTKMAIRFEGDNVREIQGQANNGRIPLEHTDDVQSLLDSGAIKDSDYVRKQLKRAAEAKERMAAITTKIKDRDFAGAWQALDFEAKALTDGVHLSSSRSDAGIEEKLDFLEPKMRAALIDSVVSLKVRSLEAYAPDLVFQNVKHLDGSVSTTSGIRFPALKSYRGKMREDRVTRMAPGLEVYNGTTAKSFISMIEDGDYVSAFERAGFDVKPVDGGVAVFSGNTFGEFEEPNGIMRYLAPHIVEIRFQGPVILGAVEMPNLRMAHTAAARNPQVTYPKLTSVWRWEELGVEAVDAKKVAPNLKTLMGGIPVAGTKPARGWFGVTPPMSLATGVDVGGRRIDVDIDASRVVAHNARVIDLPMRARSAVRNRINSKAKHDEYISDLLQLPAVHLTRASKRLAEAEARVEFVAGRLSTNYNWWMARWSGGGGPITPENVRIEYANASAWRRPRYLLAMRRYLDAVERKEALRKQIEKDHGLVEIMRDGSPEVWVRTEDRAAGELSKAGVSGIEISRGTVTIFDGMAFRAKAQDGKQVSASERREAINRALNRPPQYVPGRDEPLYALARDVTTGRSMHADLDALGYYSKALEAAKAWPQSKGTPEQALMWLQKSGTKQAEIDATGVGKAFSGPVTRDDLVKYLGENRTRVNENVNDRGAVLGRDGTWRPTFENTKWSSYSLDPSNPTYRETVLHLPDTMKESQQWKVKQPNGFTRGTYGDEAAARRGMQAGDTLEQAESITLGTGFRSGHFPEPNIIGHMMTSMVKIDKEPVFLIDQIQSDWGQRIRDDGGVRDEGKIAELKVAIARNKLAMDDASKVAIEDVLIRDYVGSPGFKEVQWKIAGDWQPHGRPVSPMSLHDDPTGFRFAAMHAEVPEYKAAVATHRLLSAELMTAEATSPGHPLVNTTDQWTNTTLRRALRQAVEADADFIAIPHGDTVLSYNPGDDAGMRGFYGSRDAEGIVPKNLRKMLEKIDKDSAKPIKVTELETPSGMKGKGFTLFPLTETVKTSVQDEGLPLFALRDDPNHMPDLTSELAKIDRMTTLKDLIEACQ